MAIVGEVPVGVETGGAGQDPRKRRQIMDGARRVFLDKGFDAASMNDIARAAGVSKGTLYVYFANKERLFVELISEEKREEIWPIVALDHSDHDVRAVLGRFGRDLLRLLTRPYYIKAMRTIFSIVERMPEIGVDFYERGPQVCGVKLAEYLTAQVEAGVLDIEDCTLAGQQFVEISQTGIMRKLLFSAGTTPTEEEIGRHIDGAVRLFMRAYGAPPLN